MEEVAALRCIDVCLRILIALHRGEYATHELHRIDLVANPYLAYVERSLYGVVDVRCHLTVYLLVGAIDDDFGNAQILLPEEIFAERRVGKEPRCIRIGYGYDIYRIGVGAGTVRLGCGVGLHRGAVRVFVELVVGRLALCLRTFGAFATCTDEYRKFDIDADRRARQHLCRRTVCGNTYAGAVDVVVVVAEYVVCFVFFIRYIELKLTLIRESVLEEHIAISAFAEVANPIQLHHPYVARGCKVAESGLGRGELVLAGIEERCARSRYFDGQIHRLDFRLVLRRATQRQQQCRRQQYN